MLVEFLGAIGLLWLLMLTLAVAGLTRHMGAIKAASVGGTAPEGGWLFDTDGPWIPSDLPPRAAAAFGSNGLETNDLVVTFFSSRCGTCLERAEEISAVTEGVTSNVFLVTGSDPDSVEEISSILARAKGQVITDPDAHDIVKSLDISSTPFAFRVVEGRVVAKAFIRSVDDYTRLAKQDLPASHNVSHATGGITMPVTTQSS